MTNSNDNSTRRKFRRGMAACLLVSLLVPGAPAMADEIMTPADYVAMCRKRVEERTEVAENLMRIGYCLRFEREWEKAAEHFMRAFGTTPDPYYFRMYVSVRTPTVEQENARQLMQMLYELDRRYWYSVIDRIDPEIDYLVLLLGDPAFAEEAFRTLANRRCDAGEVKSLFMHLREPRNFNRIDQPLFVQLVICLSPQGEEVKTTAREGLATIAKEREMLAAIAKEMIMSGATAAEALDRTSSRRTYLTRLEVAMNLIVSGEVEELRSRKLRQLAERNSMERSNAKGTVHSRVEDQFEEGQIVSVGGTNLVRQRILNNRMAMLVPEGVKNGAHPSEQERLAKFWESPSRIDVDALRLSEVCTDEAQLDRLRIAEEAKLRSFPALGSVAIATSELVKINGVDAFVIRALQTANTIISNKIQITLVGIPLDGTLVVVTISVPADRAERCKDAIERIVKSIRIK